MIPDRRLEDLTGNENRSSEIERRKGTQCGSYHGCGRVVSQMILAASTAMAMAEAKSTTFGLPLAALSQRERRRKIIPFHLRPRRTTSIAIEFRLRSRFRSTVYDTIDELYTWSPYTVDHSIHKAVNTVAKVDERWILNG